MTAYYNEFDPFAAAWLRELIKAGVIADGEVDERSILDVAPNDLAGFTQCHFFAGIGVWSYALRNAGWPDDRPVWTASCPCQPFSGAGKGLGFADERHLWPAAFHLISIEKPPVVFGEQVASKDGLAWLDLVQADLEGQSYAVGAVDTCAAGFGSPNIRQRLYWVADTESGGWREEQPDFARGIAGNGEGEAFMCAGCGAAHGLADAKCTGGRSKEKTADHREQKTDRPANRACGCGGASCWMAYASCERRGEVRNGDNSGHDGAQFNANGQDDRPGPVNGYWRDADWLFCRDGRWRAVESSTFPLVDGDSSRVGQLRGYGNAINAYQAQAFIEAFVEEKTVR